ncbi:MAG TPA: argininosuccinate lyase [Polyangia bacterium]|jgi:argininosuccinate lyase|nr:argininosuccinate lyase [Polyangia bacterium]
MSTEKPGSGGRGARFDGAMDPAAAALNASVDFDRRLLRDDIRGSQAQARMLAAVGLISAADAEAIIAGLDAAAKEFESGARPLNPALEDIHMNVEGRLIELIGEPGRRLHTARSRNDQVATDLKLYARAAAVELAAAIDRTRVALCRRAREHADTLLPGYTHLQRAQAVTLGHHLLAYAEMLGRDRGRLLDGARRAGQSPLGSGALAATGLPIDRARTTKELGFDEPTHNSLDAVSDRDFAAELTFACALIGVHLSRFGEELVLWSTTEFGFVRLGEGYCSGSSLMPQKRNPDIAELLRAKPARVIGDLVALLTISKGLPLAYNKDLQESQEPLYDAVETARLSLSVMPGLVAGLEFNTERMREAAGDPALGATDLAEEMVRRGMPFRTAHEVVGRLVKLAEQRKVSLRALGADELRAVEPSLTPLVLEALDPARAVAARVVTGGPAPTAVRRELDRLEAELTALGFAV